MVRIIVKECQLYQGVLGNFHAFRLCQLGKITHSCNNGGKERINSTSKHPGTSAFQRWIELYISLFSHSISYLTTMWQVLKVNFYFKTCETHLSRLVYEFLSQVLRHSHRKN